LAWVLSKVLLTTPELLMPTLPLTLVAVTLLAHVAVGLAPAMCGSAGVASEPSEPVAWLWKSPAADVPAGLAAAATVGVDGWLGFSYASTASLTGAIRAYSGLNGTGTLLGSFDFAANTNDFTQRTAASLGFNGLAKSFDLSASRQARHDHANSFAAGVIYLTTTHPGSQTVFMKWPGGTDFAFRNDHAGMTPGPYNATPPRPFGPSAPRQSTVACSRHALGPHHRPARQRASP
jgi:hypothetical protein